MQDLKARYRKFDIDVALIIQEPPQNIINTAYSRQLIRSSSSPGTNYRAALRGKSTADFTNKLKIVEEELDQSTHFLDLLLNFNPKRETEIARLLKEGHELWAITVKSIQTTRSKLRTS